MDDAGHFLRSLLVKALNTRNTALLIELVTKNSPDSVRTSIKGDWGAGELSLLHQALNELHFENGVMARILLSVDLNLNATQKMKLLVETRPEFMNILYGYSKELSNFPVKSGFGKPQFREQASRIVEETKMKVLEFLNIEVKGVLEGGKRFTRKGARRFDRRVHS